MDSKEIADRLFEAIAKRVDQFFKRKNIQGGVRCGGDLFSPMDKHELVKTLDHLIATARAEALRAAQDCNGCWLDDSKAHIACINCRRSNPDLYRTTADIILADKQEPTK
jgi:hypothetical protein